MTMSPTIKPKVPPALVLAIGITASSTASTFIRLAQGTMSSLAIAAWRLTIASLILAPFALTKCRDEWRKLTCREWLLAVASGLILAVHFYTWTTSLALTSVAASTVLVATTPLFVGALSYVILRERMTRAMTAGMLVALIGTAVIGLSDVGGTHGLTGDLLALTGALAAAGYMLIGRHLRTSQSSATLPQSSAALSLLGYVFPVYGTAAIALMGLALLNGETLTGQPAQTWLWLALMAIFPQIVGHSSINWALGHLPTAFVALGLLAEPIGSTLLAWIILHEPPTPAALIGGLLILAGIGIATMTKDKSTSRSQT